MAALGWFIAGLFVGILAVLVGVIIADDEEDEAL